MCKILSDNGSQFDGIEKSFRAVESKNLNYVGQKLYAKKNGRTENQHGNGRLQWEHKTVQHVHGVDDRGVSEFG